MAHERLNVPEKDRYVINPITGCWLWLGTIDKEGYGRATSGVAHRFMYTLLRGEIPPGLVLDHLCVRRNCVNPDHLEAVTGAENLARSRAYVRPVEWSRTACSRGHEYNDENSKVYEYTKTNGETATYRYCIPCHKMTRAARRERNKRASA